jgi:transglutaminase-like putative cysteine protease/predicted glutamine amidotransferase
MPNLLAMSFEGELAPSFDLRCLRPEGKTPDGWGLGFYPGGEPSAQVLKEAAPPPHGSIRSELVKAWQHLESSLFVVHVRRARWGQLSDANTQPFLRSYAGRDWMIAHGGSLAARLELPAGWRFEPVGSTDTERIFCRLLGLIAERGWRSLGEADPKVLRAWLAELNDQGSMTLVLTDGRDLAAYADRDDDAGIYLWHLTPPYSSVVFGDTDLQIDLTSRGMEGRAGIVLASEPLPASTPSDVKIEWRKLPPGELVIVRQGAIRSRAWPTESGSIRVKQSLPPAVPATRPERSPTRTYDVRHRTVYRYAKEVERSTHVLRLFPFHDRTQSVLSNEITLSVPAKISDYDDVFGNRVRRALIEAPYSELTIDARARVEVRDAPLDLARARSNIPLVWMPWQRHMLQPYLLPPELPDSQLAELVGYAMSFVERNDADLLDTLLDLNGTIFTQYAYRPGTTSLSTSAFDVFTARRGVCQDFANLFICLARLLSIPARYVCGYVFTGDKAPNAAQGDASHAWVEVYLPEVGWRGFDPTNGKLAQTEHVRLAVGRSYVDATPTAGTIYVGGGPEQLAVDVKVVKVTEGT